MVLFVSCDLEAILKEVNGLRTEFGHFRERFLEGQAFDLRRIAGLEQAKNHLVKKDRGAIFNALLIANRGKMFAKDARQ